MSKRSGRTRGVEADAKGFGLRLMDEIQNEGSAHHRTVARVEAITGRKLIRLIRKHAAYFFPVSSNAYDILVKSF